jgi:ADP-L-glycero-D-manno-heptose 6-epimerase
MIVVTGGAGFIGSAIVWALNSRGYRKILIVDLLDKSKKWGNLDCLKFSDSINRDEFIEKLQQGKFSDKIDAIIHMGAESSTTVYDVDYLTQNNFKYTKKLAIWCVENNKRFVYASSAATYGDGKQLQLEKLKPLNPYANSKHLFDLWAYKEGLLEKFAGLKYFNCFGPNEYHKAGMRSMALQAFEQIKRDGKVKLFKSYNPQYKDGGQLRDFIYVKDAVDMTLFLFENQKANGIFNIGTGKAQSFNELARAVFDAMGKDADIEYIDMLDSIKDKYQYFTQASMTKLIKAGYKKKIHTLQESVSDYVKNYLLKSNSYLGNELDNEF